MNNANELASLLRKKEDLKLALKREKQKVEAQKKSIENQKQRAEDGKANTLAFEQKQLPVFISGLQNVESELKEVKINIQIIKNDLNNLSLQQPKVTQFFLTPFERIMRELNVVAWSFECQFMEASTNLATAPILHSKGRYLAGIYNIKSNVEMIKLQDYIQHYTQRFESSTNTVLVENELLKIHEKASSILSYYNEKLIGNVEIINQFHNNTPNEFEERMSYLDKHTGFIVVNDLNPLHIVFGKEDWNKHFEFNYAVTNDTLALFCQKLIDFIDKFDLKNKAPQQDETEFKFENKFDKLEPNKVYEYFNNTLVKKGYLSKADLESYLILAFQDKTVPKEKITFSNRHIGNITGVFYKYYDNADNTHGKQEQYAELLGEYFKGFTTKKVINNFAKSK